MTRSPRRPRRSPHQVHDGLFKQVLGEPARAAAELCAVLPADAAARIGAALLSYLCIVNPDLDVEIMRDYLTNEIGPEVEETVMTAGLRLIQQGYDKGLEEGRDTLCAILLRQLDQRFGRLPEAVESRIEAAGAEDLERWLDRVIAARSLDDVFAIG